MNWQQASEAILKTMLGHLGYPIEVEASEESESYVLHIASDDSKHLIGRNGDRLEDIQYLVNRILQKHQPNAPRVRIDCDHYRAEQEAKLVEKSKELAAKVRETGKSIRTRPLNAYYRRIVHNALVGEGVATQSPKKPARYKRIEIRPLSS